MKLTNLLCFLLIGTLFSCGDRNIDVEERRAFWRKQNADEGYGYRLRDYSILMSFPVHSKENIEHFEKERQLSLVLRVNYTDSVFPIYLDQNKTIWENNLYSVNASSTCLKYMNEICIDYLVDTEVVLKRVDEVLNGTFFLKNEGRYRVNLKRNVEPSKIEYEGNFWHFSGKAYKDDIATKYSIAIPNPGEVASNLFVERLYLNSLDDFLEGNLSSFFVPLNIDPDDYSFYRYGASTAKVDEFDFDNGFFSFNYSIERGVRYRNHTYKEEGKGTVEFELYE